MITATLGNPFKVSLELGEIHKEMGQHVVSCQGSQHSLGAAITCVWMEQRQPRGIPPALHCPS